MSQSNFLLDVHKIQDKNMNVKSFVFIEDLVKLFLLQTLFFLVAKLLFDLLCPGGCGQHFFKPLKFMYRAGLGCRY